ncbi:restriction endonuclease subunit S [Campylobacter concisus]|uniref:restriction endonuclease subunit S n=1 Tax=Campylobacter concisus TaxID=199 RepID=UPI0011E78BA7|nr:restriction endonuclease subunit S [Campylobacter concisus]
MSKIFDLINELCPDGVEFKELGEIADIVRGQRVTKAELQNDGKYPVVSGGIKPLGFLNKFNREANTITVAQYGTAGYINFIEEKFWANDVCYCIFPKKEISNKFLLYCLMKNQEFIYSLRTNAIPAHLPQKLLSEIKLPVPPMEVQREIVHILDSFTSVTEELMAKLTAELIARKKQYEFYRDFLLSFDELDKNGGGCELKMLGDIGEVRMCKRILKEQTSVNGEIPFYKIGTFGKEADAYISKELFDEYRSKYNYPKIGEVLISASGTIGRAVIFNGNDAYFQDSNIVWIENDEGQVLNRYLFYFYQIADWNIAEGGTIKRLYNDNLKKIKIPIPSLQTQQKVVDILDKFDTLVNSITEGLPREIELRRKQYEHYRELLLNFKPKMRA